jgi:hypothetical protein
MKSGLQGEERNNLLITSSLREPSDGRRCAKATAGGLEMYYRKTIHVPRSVRQTLEWVAVIGTALLFSYLILQVRW